MMKIIKITLLLLISIAAPQLSAQTSIIPIDATVNFDNDQRPCIQTNLDPEPKTLKKAWRNYLKDNYDFKLKGIGFLSNKDLLSAEKIIVPQISSDAMDFYTQILEDENGSEMKVFVRHGYDIYINKNNYPNEYKTLHEILENFIKFYIPKYHQNKINDTEKRIEKLTDETEDLQEDISDNTSTIANLKKEIEKLEDELKSNTEMLETANKKLIKRNAKLIRIKNQIKKL